MAENNNNKKENSSQFVLTDRKNVSINGVLDVVSFDDCCVTLSTHFGDMIVEGSELRIGVLDVDRGVVTLTGAINAMYYANREDKSKKSFTSKLFK
jgi:sporulation protein YabP